MDRKELLEQEIRDLTAKLTDSTSDIGDWKYIKSFEYTRAGKEIPYDLDELDKQRQAVRDRINEIKEELKTL